MSNASALEARVTDLQSEDLSTETLRDILRDMLDLEPADYANVTTDLCFRLFDLQKDSEDEAPKTMNDFVEADK